MTAEELRELDAEVAVKVMGARLHPIASPGGSVTGETVPMPDGSTVDRQLACYSTDIAAAMQVAEKLSEMNHTLVLEDWRSDRQRWCALFHLADGHDTGQFIADTAALAITLAALKAVNAVRWVKPVR